jgi:hypothetical protein
MKSGRQERFKIWEIDKFFKCPIVGISLTIAEQKHMMKKVGICTKKKSPYDIHEIMVASCDTKNPLSQKFENKLDKKFGKTSVPLFEMDKESFMDYWRRCFDNGDYQVALWVAACRPDLSIENRREIFGMVHMAMHWNGEQRATYSKKLSASETRKNDVEQNLEKIAGEKRLMEKKNMELEEKSNRLQARLEMVNEENNGLTSRLQELECTSKVAELEHLMVQLRSQRNESSAAIEQKDRHIIKLRKENNRLSKAFDQLIKTNNQMQKSLLESIRNMRRINTCDENCAAFDLCQKRILIVGGIARMEALYRELIENNGGIFEYHEGHMKGGSRELEDRFKRSDIILCPVNCNSHAACTMVKNLGKKHNKPVHMLPNFSLSIISQVIRDCGKSIFPNSPN